MFLLAPLQLYGMYLAKRAKDARGDEMPLAKVGDSPIESTTVATLNWLRQSIIARTSYWSPE